MQRFFPAGVDIKAGDTVRWRSVTVTEHTVTFGPFPEGIPRAGNPLVDNVSRPGDEYTGEGYWNSGMLGVDSFAGVTFELTFPDPGEFAYYCIPHLEQGMTGVINVAARDAEPTPTEAPTPSPPDTGSGLDDVSEGSSGFGDWLMTMLFHSVVSLVLTLPVAVFVLVRQVRRF